VGKGVHYSTAVTCNLVGIASKLEGTRRSLASSGLSLCYNSSQHCQVVLAVPSTDYHTRILVLLYAIWAGRELLKYNPNPNLLDTLLSRRTVSWHYINKIARAGFWFGRMERDFTIIYDGRWLAPVCGFVAYDNRCSSGTSLEYYCTKTQSSNAQYNR